MKAYKTSQIRNVALLGHGDAGKTSLTSSLLYAAGALNRLGKVDDGTSTTDYDEEEIERKVSIQTSMAHVEWNQHKLNLVDTPGYPAFVADGRGALEVTELGLIVIDAVAGVQVITRRSFRQAETVNLPVMFVLNKMDRERADFDAVVATLQESFGRTVMPLQLPIGKEQSFKGMVDLLSMKAHVYESEGDGKPNKEDIPGDLQGAAEEARATLVEMVAETDDALMETFFDQGDLPAEELKTGLAKAVAQRKIFPVLCAAATHSIGSQSLLDALIAFATPPGTLGPARGVDPEEGGELTREVDDSAPLSLRVFKTVADPYSGRLSLFRVCSGTVKHDSHVVNINRGVNERMGNISLLQGKQPVAVDQIHAGDLGVAAKLKDTHTGDSLADASNPIRYAEIDFPEPSISFAVDPKSKGDEEKIASGLQRLADEDVVLRVGRDPQTGELLVSGTGQLHVEVAISMMKRKFGVEAILHPPKVPYLETIRHKVENIEGKHKKQSGGRGQFGVCVIHLEPLPHGAGFEFVDKIFGGSIPQNYRPAVEKGVKESAEKGWLSGNPVIDFRVTLVDGKYHNVDSSEMAFKIAGSLAFKEGMAKARPTILEPIMNVEITAPEECMGDIMGDLSSRRGKPQGMEAQGHYQIIRAQVPMSEMLSYASTLKSFTSDRGSYHTEFDHYDEAPQSIQQQIIAAHKKKIEEA